jgi:hypothetical protein
MHATQQMTSRPVHLREQRRQTLTVVDPVRPVLELPDVAFIYAFHAEIVVGIRRTVKINTAFFAYFRLWILRSFDRLRVAG